ncbi:MAG: hypothetical protein IKA61_05830 [Clostridia bacterium]|nr:hypothetical protein [Clostridia bacterium]
MKKIISLALAGLLTLSVGVSCNSSGGSSLQQGGQYDITDIVAPEYSTDDYVQITAYAGPCPPPKSGAVNTFTDYHFQKVAEAGFTHVIALYEGNAVSPSGLSPKEQIIAKSKKAEEVALQALDMCEKYGLKYYVRDWTFYGLSRELERLGIPLTYENYDEVISAMFSEENQYINHPAYGGNFAFDEPFYEELDGIAWQAELYEKYVGLNGNGQGEVMVNLYPSYIGSSVSNQGYKTYEDYVNKYFEDIAPIIGYVSYDFYPFKANAYTGSAMKTQYLFNLDLIAKKCKETRNTDNPIEMRTFIQTVGDFTGLRSMSSIGDLRFQIYCALAFGSKEIKYYKYIDAQDDSADADWALLSYSTGEYTWLYDCAKTVNNEVHAFEDAYLNFEWEGVMYNNADPMVDNQNFANMISKSAEHPRIASIESTEDALMTYFKDKDGNDAFMLVNFTDPYFQKDNQVTVKFNDARALLMYRLGQRIIVPLNTDGTYTFNLYSGEGRFVIPLK